MNFKNLFDVTLFASISALLLSGCNSHIQTVKANNGGQIEFDKIDDPELIGKARPNDVTISYARELKENWTREEM